MTNEDYQQKACEGKPREVQQYICTYCGEHISSDLKIFNQHKQTCERRKKFIDKDLTHKL